MRAAAAWCAWAMASLVNAGSLRVPSVLGHPPSRTRFSKPGFDPASVFLRTHGSNQKRLCAKLCAQRTRGQGACSRGKAQPGGVPLAARGGGALELGTWPLALAYTIAY